MKYISPSLLALAAFAVFPSAYGLDVKDDDMKLALIMRLQIRAERATASDNLGDNYNVANGISGKPDTMDFYLRRFRLGFKGTYQQNYKFEGIIRMDNADRTAAGDTGRSTVAHKAFLARTWKPTTEGDLEHTVSAGLNYPFFNFVNVASSSTQMFPSARATEAGSFLAPRGVGIAYLMGGKIMDQTFTWGADIQNNVGDDATAVRSEGMVYTTRLQVTPMDTVAGGHMKPQESFVGATGTGLMVGLSYGINKNDVTSATAMASRKVSGIDVLFHHDALSAMFEYRVGQLRTENNVAVDTKVGSKAIIFQAGWAIPMEDTVLEPAFRWSRIDLDRDTIETSAFGTGDFGNSGFQTELGVNWYLNKHSNKLQLAYLDWRGEQSGSAAVESAAHARILRAQWQINF